ncbi:hypothetical protein BZA70DRAFT_277159 [Myxozyma melibiosi]|uniref:t-SNARE coiled-coil homology domain-containing protein n=1 Tax=Myxozyma melibiosi TaxID=54550 RepID=A0ABR1F7M0_9ASCO
MKKFLGRSKRSSSPTPSEMSVSANDYGNPYTSSPDYTQRSEGRKNPYAINDGKYNTAPRAPASSSGEGDYNPYASGPGSNSSSFSSSSSSSSGGDANPYQSSEAPHNPYEVSSRPSNSYAPARGRPQAQHSLSASSAAPAPAPAASRDHNPYGSYQPVSTTALPDYASYDGDAAPSYHSAPGSHYGSTTSVNTLPARQEDDAVSIADSTRQELFKGARNRFKLKTPSIRSGKDEQSQMQAQTFMPEQSSDYDPSIMETEAERAARYGEQPGSSSGNVYAETAYGSSVNFDELREQQEQEEEAQVQEMKQQMKYIKGQSLGSAQNARRYAEEAEASGLRTLAMLGEQSDRLANSEASLAVTENQTKLAEDYAKELKSLNRSMFAVHVSNPFNSRRRLQEQEKRIRDTFSSQQDAREDNRRVQYQAQMRIGEAMGNLPGQRRRQLTDTELRYREQMQKQKAGLAQASRFQFEPDDEDFELERDIDATLDDVGAASQRLHSMAQSLNSELESQNKRVNKLNEKTQEVEINVHLNTSRLAKIK